MLAIDLDADDVTAIGAGGFSVESGSFGTPMRVQKSERYLHVPINGQLPNVSEQEVIAADLASPAPSDDLDVGEEPVGKAIWQQMSRGVLDPRPYLMHAAREYFDRIYAHGGVFVLFADAVSNPSYVEADFRSIAYGDPVRADNWSLLSALEALHVSRDFGREIKIADRTIASIAEALEVETPFTCVVEPYESAKDRWVTLATNKYGKPVAGLLVPEKKESGLIFVFPRVKERGKLVRGLLEDFLPRISPKLFPENERHAWIEQSVYALPGVMELQQQIDEVKAETAKKVGALQAQIATCREESAHLHQLLTASGDELVAAVKKTLESVGFDDVRDVDTEEGAKEGRLGEDLQIWQDPEPTVLVEVKGINGSPKDDDVFQVVKNIMPRSKEWKRFDVRGLSVINHERGFPPLDRSRQPFQKAQIESAEGQHLGLLTTWGLYRLARGYARNDWKPEDIAELLTQTSGKVEAVPTHYTRVGQIENYYEQAEAVVVELTEGQEIRAGDTIAFVLPVDFVEEVATSVQVNGEGVDVSPSTGRVGLKTGLTKEQARQKTPVYRVSLRQ